MARMVYLNSGIVTAGNDLWVNAIGNNAGYGSRMPSQDTYLMLRADIPHTGHTIPAAGDQQIQSGMQCHSKHC